MKIKVKNIKTGVIKSIESNILSIYLATKEWEKYVEEAPKVEGKEKQEKKDKSSYSMENNSESK